MKRFTPLRKPSYICITLLVIAAIVISVVTGDEAEIHASSAYTASDAMGEEWLPSSSPCSPSIYYKDINLFSSRNELQKLLEETHKEVLPYTDNDADDVWKALKDLDRGIDSNGSPTVRLIYSKKNVPAEPKGTTDTWNREHVWPKSRGVGHSGPDFTDVHHLFPADWGVNSIRNNRFFDNCNVVEEDICRPPTELEHIDDPPMFGGEVFQPPLEVRGDIARAIFYMELRYPHLELTDSLDPEKTNQMAYLSTLLAWHDLDPPTDYERKRNDRACSRWQGNRNPFVDFPDLAKIIHGTPSETITDDGFYDDNSTGIVEELTEVKFPIAGDVMVVGVHTDNPDMVALVTFVDLPAGLVIHVTDNAYDGHSFASNEGTISLTLPETIAAGTIFGYGEGLLYGSSWTSEMDRGFALATSGDNMIIYHTSSLESDDYVFLSAILFAGGTLLESNMGESALYGTSSTAIPDLIKRYTVVLENKDNYVYIGKRVDSKEYLQHLLLDSANWEGSNSKTDVSTLPIVTENTVGFTVTEQS